MYKYLITINPLGVLYGSAGAFLSPENLVGSSNAKFPPDAYTLSGLFFAANKVKPFTDHEELKKLHVAGPFWAGLDDPEYFYLPIPWTKIVNAEKNRADEWEIRNNKWYRKYQDEYIRDGEERAKIEPDCRWQKVNYWNDSAEQILKNDGGGKDPWAYTPVLHPKLLKNERCVDQNESYAQKKGGLFLENCVQMGYGEEGDETCLVYLSTHPIPNGWYCFGGESHLVEITSLQLSENSSIINMLKEKIQRSFALITPGVWGSNRFSRRYPDSEQTTFPKPSHILTDRPLPYRYRIGNNRGGGRLGRGRYAVPSGTVYVFEEPLNKSWWGDDNESAFPDEWFPHEGFSLRQLGCGLCLPLTVIGID